MHQVRGEKDVFDAADVWLKFHSEKCCKVVPRLPLDRLPRDYLHENVYKAPYIQKCNICLSHVLDLIENDANGVMRMKLPKKRQPQVVYIVGGSRPQGNNSANRSPNGSMASMEMYSVVQNDWRSKETRVREHGGV